MPHPMFAAHVRMLDAIRAERQLDALQVQSAPHMSQDDHKSFTDGLLERARGAVVAVAQEFESVIWNGRVLGTARAIKATAVKMLERGLVG